MERLIDLKRKLVNLSVIYNELESQLTKGEMMILSKSAKGETLGEIGKATGVSCSQALRLLCKVKEKCARILGRYDFKQYTEILSRIKKKAA